MKRIFATFTLLMTIACGSSKPGSISVALTLDGAVDEGSIAQFVFLIGDASSTQKLLFPSSCLGTAADGTQCLKTEDCGYLPTDSTFEPEIDFNSIGEDETLEIISCALDAGQTPIAGGVGEVENADGSSVTINMTTTVIECINGLPDLC